jgi:nucleotidyltransferase/DNA polymerase involved in DNA repair
MTDARLLALVWPDLRLTDADATPFEPMLDALDDLSPRIEAVDVGVALVDITGLGALVGTERRIAARAVALVREVAPLSVRAGVGDNRWLAVLAARLARPSSEHAPAAFTSLDRSDLGELPLTLLPADAATRQRFTLFGLTTFGQLAALPRSAVGAQFGAAGERLQQLTRGNDPRPLVPRRRPERLTTERTFEPPLTDVGAAGLALRALATELVDRLRARHLAPGRAALELGREDAPVLHIELAFPQPALEPDWIARLLLSRLEAAAHDVRPRRSLPDSNQDRLRQPSRSNPGPMQPQKLGESMSPGRHRLSAAVVTPPTPLVVGIWQQRGDEEREEPRITRISLTFDRLANPQSRQLAAFEPQSGKWEELRWALERLQARFGDGRLWRAEHVRPNAARPELRARLGDIGS